MVEELDDETYAYVAVKGKSGQIEIISFHPMFEEEYLIVKAYEDHIEISVPTIDYSGKSRSTYVKNNRREGCRAVSVMSNLPQGRYSIDEDESDEDLLVIYKDEN